jgi:hypothetical protein
MAKSNISYTTRSNLTTSEWYVTPAGDDTHACSSISSPCATINGAIGKASPGDFIYVAIGTYLNANSNAVVMIETNISLSGGWNNTFSRQIGESTIDGEGLRRGIINQAVTEIERFRIQNSYAGGDPNAGAGAGILNNGTLTLTHCT